MIRRAAVAGQFYPDDVARLDAELARCFSVHEEALPAIGVIVPHAGYRYSGATAGRVLGSTLVPPCCVLLGPNHTGRGSAISLMAEGSWDLPGGAVPIDQELAAKLAGLSGVRVDERAHASEHSLEVLLPMLRHRQPKLRFVPLTLARLSYEQCQRLGAELAATLADIEGDAPLMVASTDMSHFLDAEAAARLDRLALDAICELSPERLYRVVEDNEISMCGVIPTTVMLEAALHLGVRQVELLEYTHSGVATGDHTRVVAYAGLRLR